MSRRKKERRERKRRKEGEQGTRERENRPDFRSDRLSQVPRRRLRDPRPPRDLGLGRRRPRRPRRRPRSRIRRRTSLDRCFAASSSVWSAWDVWSPPCGSDGSAAVNYEPGLQGARTSTEPRYCKGFSHLYIYVLVLALTQCLISGVELEQEECVFLHI